MSEPIVDAVTLPLGESKIRLRIPSLQTWLYLDKGHDEQIDIDRVHPNDLRRICELWTDAMLAWAEQRRKDREKA